MCTDVYNSALEAFRKMKHSAVRPTGTHGMSSVIKFFIRRRQEGLSQGNCGDGSRDHSDAVAGRGHKPRNVGPSRRCKE